MCKRWITIIGMSFLAWPMAGLAHSYSYIEGGYAEHEDEGGLRLGASLSLSHQFAAFGEVFDAGDIEELSAGVLLHRPLDSRVDWLLGLSLESIEIGRRDDTGLGLRAGLRWQLPHPLVELRPEIRHQEVFDQGLTSLRLAGLVSLARQLKLQIAVQGGDHDHLEAGIRYDF